jgi:multiple sugar transport system ATP-binding protein
MYDRPANVFVAGFIGSPAMNLITVPLDKDGVRLGSFHLPISREAHKAATDEGGTEVTIGVRPESLDLTTDPSAIPVTVNVVEELGADAIMHGSALINSHEQPIVARVDARRPPEKGTMLHLAPRAGETHVFSTLTGERLTD